MRAGHARASIPCGWVRAMRGFEPLERAPIFRCLSLVIPFGRIDAVREAGDEPRPNWIINLAIFLRDRRAVGWVICSFRAISRAPSPSARQSRMAFSRGVRDLESNPSNSRALI